VYHCSEKSGMHNASLASVQTKKVEEAIIRERQLLDGNGSRRKRACVGGD
jgi:hypothetical protein